MGSIVAEIADKIASAGGGERSELEVRGGVGADGGGILTLSTSELTVVDGDKLGRIDFQVKIRGYRIELGEIESRLAEVDHIQDAVVLALDDANGNKYLCGYYVCDQADLQLDHQQLQQALKANLPDYMVPELYVPLPVFPLTPNGKVNRKGLPEPDLSALQAKYVAPRNAHEQLLVDQIQLIMNVKEVSVLDHFFKLGGSSISAIALTSKLSQQGFSLAVSDIFEQPIVQDLAKLLELAQAEEIIHSAPDLSHYPVTSSQKGMFLTDTIGEQNTAYNIPICLRFSGEIDKAHMGLAIDALMVSYTSFDT